MKINNKAIISTLIALTIVLPQVVSASWWNPFSWSWSWIFGGAPSSVDVHLVPPTETGPGIVVVSTTTPLSGDAGVNNIPAPTTPAVKTTTTVVTTTTIPKPVVTTPVACTMEAKLCPGGTYVGRTGPTCAFAPCPAIPTSPTTTTTTATTTTTTTTTVPPVAVNVPSYALDVTFTPGGFNFPRTVKNGQVLLLADPSGTAGASGDWYVDRVKWRLVSDTFRTGDMTVSILAGSRWVEDSTDANVTHTTTMSGHFASEPLSFAINGQVPNKGLFYIVIDEIAGHMKADATGKTYVFMGTPISGPEFRI